MPAKLIYLGKRYGLSQVSECIIGRHRGCDLPVQDKSCSRQHCKIIRHDQTFELLDLGSANGTRLNGVKIGEPTVLKDGDLIQIGESNLKFAFPEAASLDQTLGLPAPPLAAAAPAAGAPISIDPTTGEFAKAEPKAKPPSSAAKPAPQAAAEVPYQRTKSEPLAPLGPITAKAFEPEDLQGLKLAGYRLQSAIISQSTGTVYTAKQFSLDRTVAVKVLSKAAVECRPNFADDVLEAARRSGRMHHEGIVQIHECGFNDGLLWYSMEYIEGDIVGRRLQQDGTIPLELVLLIADRLANALREAHRVGIPHLDIRPDNILISHTGIVKLVDFGVAPLLQEARQIIEDGTVRGNPLYVAPEYGAEPSPDPLHDIYALGCTLFHLIAGKPPFTGHRSKDILAAHQNNPIPDITANRPDLPHELADLFNGMLAKNHEWRFQTIDEWQGVVTDLRQKVADGPSAEPASPAAPARPLAAPKPRQRSSTTTSLPPRRQGNGGIWISLLLVLILAGGAWFFYPHLKKLVDRQNGGTSDPIATKPTKPDPTDPPAVKPIPTPPRPNPATTEDPPPATDPLVTEWTTVQQQVATRTGNQRWSQAEFGLLRFLGKARKANNDRLATVVASQLDQLRQDAANWYTKASADLPPETALNLLLDRLTDLRSRVATGQRADLESRYRQAIDLLRRELAVIRRDLIQLIEQGALDQLDARAGKRSVSLQGTALADLEVQLTTQAREAASLPWHEDWPTTRQRLDQATGDGALGAAAALMLMGDRKRAVDLLFRDQSLNGDLGRRRDALLATQAVLLNFTNPGDLGHFRIQAGEPFSRDGVLSSSPDSGVRLDCAVPIGADGWEIAMRLTVGAPTDAEITSAQISIVKNDEAALALRIDPQQFHLRVDGPQQTAEQQTPRDGAACNLRLRVVDRQLQVVTDSATLLDGVPITVPPDSNLRFEFIGVPWQLDELSVIGGR